MFHTCLQVCPQCSSLWKTGLNCCAAAEIYVEMLQVLCSFAFHFLNAIHCKLEKTWRILIVVPEGVTICSVIFAQLLRECSAYTQKKLWLQNFFAYASASLQMKVHFEKFQSVPKIKITLPQQSGILCFYLYHLRTKLSLLDCVSERYILPIEIA